MSDAPISPHQATPAELEERLVAERAGDPFILYHDGHGRQRIVTLAEGFDYTIGRNPDTDIPIVWDEQVSGLHAEVRHAGGSWLILDDGLSRNGTHVNGERVQGRRRLRDADQVGIGQTGLTYLTLPASGTFVTGRYGRGGPANRRPPGVSVMSLGLNRPTATTAGDAVAVLRLAKGTSFPASRHSLAILLTDADTGAPVSLDYKRALSTHSDARGNLQRVRLRLPAGTILPESVRAYVIADVFPILARRL